MAASERGRGRACVRGGGGRGKMAELGKKYCVYCLAEVSSLRFRCTECADIELCPDCFSAGAEIGPHRRWHGYQLVDGGRFTLWGAEAEGGWSSREEQLLLDAIEQFGFGNWVRVGPRRAAGRGLRGGSVTSWGGVVAPGGGNPKPSRFSPCCGVGLPGAAAALRAPVPAHRPRSEAFLLYVYSFSIPCFNLKLFSFPYCCRL